MGFSGLSDDAGGNALTVTRYGGFGYGLNGESWGRPGRIRELRYLMSMETMLADMRLAMVPASMARRPSWARSLRRLGTRAPMPPICMPMLPTLAKPQRAKVAMEKLLGERVDLSWPSWVKATNSLIMVRVPRRLPMVRASPQGMPMSQATGAPTTPRIALSEWGKGMWPC